MRLAGSRTLTCLWTLAAWAACLPAYAALGGDITTIEADRQHMQGERREPMTAAGYTVHEFVTPTNTVVREYVSAAGKVFAVSWRGPLLPDLSRTLGAYFTQYQDAAAAPHAGHRHLIIQQPDLVVHSNGHMRAFYGHAFVPSLLPPGFSADLIR